MDRTGGRPRPPPCLRRVRSAHLTCGTTFKYAFTRLVGARLHSTWLVADLARGLADRASNADKSQCCTNGRTLLAQAVANNQLDATGQLLFTSVLSYICGATACQATGTSYGGSSQAAAATLPASTTFGLTPTRLTSSAQSACGGLVTAVNNLPQTKASSKEPTQIAVATCIDSVRNYKTALDSIGRSPILRWPPVVGTSSCSRVSPLRL